MSEQPEDSLHGVPTPVRGREVQQVLLAERSGRPFMLLREPSGTLRTVDLGAEGHTLALGREPTCGIALTWDPGVSRVHAEVVALSGSFAIVDDGLSRNGTFVNGERISGRRRLRDRDLVKVGATLMVFRDPVSLRPVATTLIGTLDADVHITPAQRRVLVALCRPMLVDPHGAPASNQEIAAELVLSIATIKSQIRALFSALDVEDLPQNRKRARLAQLGLQLGLVHERDLAPRA